MSNEKPRGILVINTIAMPKDANANGDIFGGWVLSQMDLGASIIAKRHSGGRVATVAIDSMSFIRPINVGDIVSCYAELLKVGRTSMHVHVETWTESLVTHEMSKVTEGRFVFVAIDDDGVPREVPKF